jgi:uncharacterized heparinase superfamily protein
MRSSTISRCWYTLRYHRPSQLARRAAKLIAARLLPASRHRRYLTVRGPLVCRHTEGLQRLAEARLETRGPDAPARAERILAGEFRFLGECRKLDSPVDFRSEAVENASQLWRFNLHYQEYLLDLLAAHGATADAPTGGEADDASDATGSNAHVRRAWELVTEWIDGNRPDKPECLGDSWHPFCISRRLPVWVILWTMAAPPKAQIVSVVASMAAQANFLADHLEHDLGGNHLLENLRALAVAGAFLDGPDRNRWLDLSEAGLRKELPGQVLLHGEHFERSPAYHAEMLELLLDVGDAVESVRPRLAVLCRDHAGRMAWFLAAVLHPDGDIPLLADSSLQGSHRIAALLRRAESAGGSDPAGRSVSTGEIDSADSSHSSENDDTEGDGAAAVGPYWTFRQGGDFLLLDAGPVGADHLPAHAHADLLTLEASVDGRRVLVDSGVHDYDAGELRQYCRSSAAHNVLTVDGADQCDMWSKFRMGFRGHPAPLRTGQTQGFDWAAARHNAYRPLGVPWAGRYVACQPGGPWLIVDWARGHGEHRLTTRLHIHPDFQVTPRADGFRISADGTILHAFPLADGEVRIEQGRYCPRFGEAHEGPVLVWEQAAKLPAACGWSLWREEPAAAPRLEVATWPQLAVVLPDGRVEVDVRG